MPRWKISISWRGRKKTMFKYLTYGDEGDVAAWLKRNYAYRFTPHELANAKIEEVML